MEAYTSYIGLFVGRIVRLRMMRVACYCEIIRALTYAAIGGPYLAILTMAYIFGALRGILLVDAIGCEDRGLPTGYLYNVARIGLGGLASIRAEECTRQIGCSIGQDAIEGRQRVFR